jgi:hypothetical protein
VNCFTRFSAYHLFGAAVAMVWACASARDLYRTDFENFTAGENTWVGTGGWVGNDATSGAQGIDQDAIPGGGLGKTAYVGYNKPKNAFTKVAKPINYTPGAGDLRVVEIETLAGIEDSTVANKNRDSFFVSVWNKNQGFLAGIRFSNDNATYGLWREDGVASTNTGVVFVRGELHLLFMRIDLANNTWSAEIDGLPLFTDVEFNASGETVEMGFLAYEWQLTSGNTLAYGDNWMMVADVTVRNWQQSGLFSYRVLGDKVEIMDYPTGETGAAAIPSQIGGLPVTTIANGAFAGCTGLASITIPASVTNIGVGAFTGCTSLANLFAEAGNPAFSSIDGVLFNAGGDEIVQFPKGRSGAYIIANGVTAIRNGAFADCAALTSVTIPRGLASIGDSAFAGCTSLVSAVFLGDAPATMGLNVFANAGSGFSVSYLAENSGFATPAWLGYPASPSTSFDVYFPSWLSAHNLPADTSPDQDLDGDGVDLLMAYALNLDPSQNLAGSMPTPSLAPGTLSISYYAASPAVVYTVKTSTDLENWTTNGVTLSGTPEDQTASVERTSPRRFLRLLVEPAN